MFFMQIAIAFFICFTSIITLAANAEGLDDHPSVEIISEGHTIPTLKRSVVVRLSTEVPERELAEIAKKIKAMDRRQYKRTFIEYYIPGMREGAGAWATTHFDPELEVRLFGNVQRFDHMSEAEAKEALADEFRAQPDVLALLEDADFQNREKASWASVSCDSMTGTDELHSRFRQSEGQDRKAYSSASYIMSWEFERQEAQGDAVISCEDAWELFGPDGKIAKGWLAAE